MFPHESPGILTTIYRHLFIIQSYQPDRLPQQKEWLKDNDKKQWEDQGSEFRSILDHPVKPNDVRFNEYGIFFTSAGHGSLIEYPNAKGLQGIASKMYADGNIISVVCHGGAIFPGVMDSLTVKSIIAGKKVTGFTTQGEAEEGVLDTVKSWSRPTIENAAEQAGAIYVAPPEP